MSKVHDKDSDDSPYVEYEDEQVSRFFRNMKMLGWREFSINMKTYEQASYDEIMLFFVKVYGLLAVTITTFYLMTLILLFTRQSTIVNYGYLDFGYGLYIGSVVCIIAVGMLAYFSERCRHFPFNLILYLTFTIGAAYVFGSPLAFQLQEGFYYGTNWIILLYFFTMTLGTYSCIVLFLFRKSTPFNACFLLSSIVVVMLFLLFIFIMTAPEYIGMLIACFFCHVIYGYLLIFDTQLMISGKFQLRTNQYISGALYLYLDVTVLIVYFSTVALYVAIKEHYKKIEYISEALD